MISFQQHHLPRLDEIACLEAVEIDATAIIADVSIQIFSSISIFRNFYSNYIIRRNSMKLITRVFVIYFLPFALTELLFVPDMFFTVPLTPTFFIAALAFAISFCGTDSTF